MAVGQAKLRRFHRCFGLCLMLPLIGWALTGLVFFIKPGYGKAYAPLAVKTYPLEEPQSLPGEPAWRECRLLRTVLGTHLLVRTAKGRQHLNAATCQPWPQPPAEDVIRLIADAVAADPARYGTVVSLEGSRAITDRDVRIDLDWQGLSLYQRGRDTDVIDRLYNIHYLRWTGIDGLDKVLGAAGLILLLALSFSGFRLWRGVRAGITGNDRQ